MSWTLVEFDAPPRRHRRGGHHRWASDFGPSGDGTRLHGRMEWQPGNALRFFSPVLGPLLRLNARRTLNELAEVLTRPLE